MVFYHFILETIPHGARYHPRFILSEDTEAQSQTLFDSMSQALCCTAPPELVGGGRGRWTLRKDLMEVESSTSPKISEEKLLQMIGMTWWSERKALMVIQSLV